MLVLRWVKPERFCAPGRDGATAIHGILVHPPAAAAVPSALQCPVLENCYAGPHGAHCPVEFGLLEMLQARTTQTLCIRGCACVSGVIL